jgi:hypothetical protein
MKSKTFKELIEDIEIPKPYFTDKVRENGDNLEQRVSDYLNAMKIPNEWNPSKGIDFIINGHIHLDCVAQSKSGSIGDKLPTKCFKYIKRYNLNDIYILHPYSPITKTVAAHLELLENVMDSNIHILDWADFTYLMNGGKFETRKAYNHVRDNVSVKNNPTNNIAMNKFFKF